MPQQNKYVLLIRRRALRVVLNLAGFININGHWIYSRRLYSKPLIIDLGANLASFSNKMIKKFDADCYTVEPNKQLFELIDLADERKSNIAITPEDGPISFYISENPEASSIIKLFEETCRNKGVTTVEGVKWKTYIKRIWLNKAPEIDILKIDIEGAELGLIESFDEHDLSKIKQITVEYHDWLNSSLHHRKIESIKKLNGLGFSGFTDAPDHSWAVEIVFVNTKLINFTFFDKLMIRLFHSISFLKYK